MSNVKKSDKLFFIVQALLKYNSFDWGVKLRSFLYKFFFKKFGKNIAIKDGVTFKYPSEIEFGDNLKIGEACFFVGLGGLSIGSNVLIGAGTKIITTGHNFEETGIEVFNQGLNFKPITIKNDVWFGFDCKVFGGAVIDDGVIVGANALVKGVHIEPYVVVVGTPAKIIKYRKH